MAVQRDFTTQKLEHARDNMTTEQIRKSIKRSEVMVGLHKSKIEEMELELETMKSLLQVEKSSLASVESGIAGLKAALKERGHKA